jgi:alpha-L-rhamnosidase
MKSMFFFLSVLLLCSFVASYSTPIQLIDLRTEYLDNPAGIIGSPRFSWILVENGYNLTASRGQKQTAFQLLVCSQSVCTMGDVWDSGKVASEQSFLVRFAGKALQSSTKYYWYAPLSFFLLFFFPFSSFPFYLKTTFRSESLAHT